MERRTRYASSKVRTGELDAGRAYHCFPRNHKMQCGDRPRPFPLPASGDVERRCGPLPPEDPELGGRANPSGAPVQLGPGILGLGGVVSRNISSRVGGGTGAEAMACQGLASSCRRCRYPKARTGRYRPRGREVVVRLVHKLHSVPLEERWRHTSQSTAHCTLFTPFGIRTLLRPAPIQ